MSENVERYLEIKYTGYDKIPIAIRESFFLDNHESMWNSQFFFEGKAEGPEVKHEEPLYVLCDNRTKNLSKALKSILEHHEIDADQKEIVKDLEFSSTSSQNKGMLMNIANDGISCNECIFMGARVPDGYMVSNSRVWKYNNGMPQRLISDTACAITAQANNLDGEELSLKLSYIGANDVEKSKWIPKGKLFSHTELYNVLTDTEFIVDTKNVVYVIEYLRHQYKLNQDDFSKKELVTTKSNGWKNDCSAFVFADKMYCKDGVKDVIVQNPIKSLTKKGELGQWIIIVAPFLRYPRVRFNCYAAMSSILLRLVGVNSFTLDMYGESGRGKTLTHKIAISHIGNPSAAGLMFNANTSIAATAALASNFSDLPLYLDEGSMEMDSQKKKQLSYMIYEEKSPNRARRDGELRDNKKWKIVMLHNGEHSMISNTTDITTGAKARCIAIQGGIDVCNLPPSEEMGEAIRILDNETHGHIFELFITEVFKHKEQLKEMYRNIQKQFEINEDPHNNRFIPTYAIIALAGTLLENVYSQIGIETLDPVKLCINMYKELVVSEPIEVSWKLVLRDLIGWIHANQSSYINYSKVGDSDYRAPRGEIHGYMRPGDVAIDINPIILKRYCRDNKIDYKGTLTEWRNAGIIDTNKEGLQKSVTINKQTIGFVRIDCFKADEVLGISDEKDLSFTAVSGGKDCVFFEATGKYVQKDSWLVTASANRSGYS